LSAQDCANWQETPSVVLHWIPGSPWNYVHRSYTANLISHIHVICSH
jgi:hypothetical protein